MPTNPASVELLTDKEGRLISTLGVYGIWLCRYMPSLKDHAGLKEIEATYNNWLAYSETKLHAKTARLLFDAIDEFCKACSHPKPASHYETGLAELLKHRRKGDAHD